jgi:hypothetical protein
MIHWTPLVMPEESTYLIEKRYGSKDPNIDDNYDDDMYTRNSDVQPPEI